MLARLRVGCQTVEGLRFEVSHPSLEKSEGWGTHSVLVSRVGPPPTRPPALSGSIPHLCLNIEGYCSFTKTATPDRGNILSSIWSSALVTNPMIGNGARPVRLVVRNLIDFPVHPPILSPARALSPATRAVISFSSASPQLASQSRNSRASLESRTLSSFSTFMFPDSGSIPVYLPMR